MLRTPLYGLRIKGQGPGLVNVLLAATHSNSFTTSALPRREHVCSGGCKRTSTSPGSWPLIARGRERVAGLAAKRTFTIPCPWPLNPQVVNELLWVAAKRTFTIPGPWPLVRLVSGVVNELLGWRPKEHSPALVPGP